jgi:hypothetical protein
MKALRAVEPDVITQATKPAQAVGTQSIIIELFHAARNIPENAFLTQYKTACAAIRQKLGSTSDWPGQQPCTSQLNEPPDFDFDFVFGYNRANQNCSLYDEQ